MCEKERVARHRNRFLLRMASLSTHVNLAPDVEELTDEVDEADTEAGLDRTVGEPVGRALVADVVDILHSSLVGPDQYKLQDLLFTESIHRLNQSICCNVRGSVVVYACAREQASRGFSISCTPEPTQFNAI